MAVGIRGLEMGAGRLYTPSRARLVVLGAVLVLVATAAEVILAIVLRRTLGVPAGFSPLTAPAVATMTIAGMIGATVAFGWLARVRPDPRAAFVRIALAALVLSWLPDLGIWVTGAFPYTTGVGVVSLMALHPVAAAFAIGILYRFGLPWPPDIVRANASCTGRQRDRCRPVRGQAQRRTSAHLSSFVFRR